MFYKMYGVGGGLNIILDTVTETPTANGNVLTTISADDCLILSAWVEQGASGNPIYVTYGESSNNTYFFHLRYALATSGVVTASTTVHYAYVYK